MTHAWLLCLALSVALMATAASVSGASDGTTAWPSQRGDPGGSALIEWPDSTAPVQTWVYRGNEKKQFIPGVPNWGSPAGAVVHGRPMVFIGGSDQSLHALDLLAKRRAWSKVTNGHILDAPVVADVGGEPAVFFGSSDRFVYALAAEDGRYLWSHELVEPTSTQGDESPGGLPVCLGCGDGQGNMASVRGERPG